MTDGLLIGKLAYSSESSGTSGSSELRYRSGELSSTRELVSTGESALSSGSSELRNSRLEAFLATIATIALRVATVATALAITALAIATVLGSDRSSEERCNEEFHLSEYRDFKIFEELSKR